MVVGLALLGASVDGIVALDSDLEAATAPTVPTRLTEDHGPAGGDGGCGQPVWSAPRSREV